MANESSTSVLLNPLTFKHIRPFISRIAPISICFDDGHYDNYTIISDIPDDRYDNFYVYGIGTVCVEFPMDIYTQTAFNENKAITGQEIKLDDGLEIFLTGEPREFEWKNDKELIFADLRNFLQRGMHFSVVMRENWEGQYYAFRSEIPESYNDYYVYGIGIEAVDTKNLSPELKKYNGNIKQLVIVLAQTPRQV